MILVKADNYSIEIGKLENSSFSKLLKDYSTAKKVILVDENTHDYCLEFLITQFDTLEEAEVILLPTGEENKVMEVCFQVWEAMSEYTISRDDLIINLGGGVVTDMGGFIASIYKRGVNFVHIPTSLLGMVDASIGGKAGVDLGSYKNQLGVFSNPLVVYVDARFLSTLPEDELNNGKAEMLKHGFIANKSHWEALLKSNLKITEAIIIESIRIKNEIVLSDPKEKDKRKLLNFGHTVGHALEGYFLYQSKIAHGRAVAWGMLVEATIAKNLNLLSQKELDELKDIITTNYEPLTIEKDDIDSIFQLMKQDKKNRENQIRCVLPTEIGKGKWDVVIQLEDFQTAITSLTK